MVEQYHIPQSHQDALLARTLGGMALDHYMDEIRARHDIDSLRLAFKSLEDRFDSEYTPAQAQAYQDNMSLTFIPNGEQCSTQKAFEIAQQRINSLSPMFGTQFRLECNKSKRLANMLREER